MARKGQTAHGIGLPPEGVDLEALERSLVVQALERSGYNQTRAATLLGLNRDQIRYRIEKFGLARPVSYLAPHVSFVPRRTCGEQFRVLSMRAAVPPDRSVRDSRCHCDVQVDGMAAFQPPRGPVRAVGKS